LERSSALSSIRGEIISGSTSTFGDFQAHRGGSQCHKRRTARLSSLLHFRTVERDSTRRDSVHDHDQVLLKCKINVLGGILKVLGQRFSTAGTRFLTLT
jgi:hypothetical protein